MGILPNDADDMTVGDILMYYRMYKIRQSKEWERFRFVAWFNAKLYDDKNKLPTPQSILSLITDPDERELAESIREQNEAEIERILELHRQKGRNV